MTLDVAAVKADFPLLGREVHGTPIVYLDSGATSQKPQAVLDAMNRYYETINANVHRGAYHIAELATIEKRHRGHQPRGPRVGAGQPD